MGFNTVGSDVRTCVVRPILRFFEYQHLPEPLQIISKPFGELALQIDGRHPEENPEAETALRKLLEAKDAAVRAGL